MKKKRIQILELILLIKIILQETDHKNESNIESSSINNDKITIIKIIIKLENITCVPRHYRLSRLGVHKSGIA